MASISVTGKLVTPANKPIPAAAVRIRTPDQDNAIVGTAKTNKDGRFTFRIKLESSQDDIVLEYKTRNAWLVLAGSPLVRRERSIQYKSITVLSEPITEYGKRIYGRLLSPKKPTARPASVVRDTRSWGNKVKELEKKIEQLNNELQSTLSIKLQLEQLVKHKDQVFFNLSGEYEKLVVKLDTQDQEFNVAHNKLKEAEDTIQSLKDKVVLLNERLKDSQVVVDEQLIEEVEISQLVNDISQQVVKGTEEMPSGWTLGDIEMSLKVLPSVNGEKARFASSLENRLLSGDQFSSLKFKVQKTAESSFVEESIMVPDVSSYTAVFAERKLTELGFIVDISPLAIKAVEGESDKQGVVIKQRPISGTEAKVGDKIELFVGKTKG